MVATPIQPVSKIAFVPRKSTCMASAFFNDICPRGQMMVPAAMRSFLSGCPAPLTRGKYNSIIIRYKSKFVVAELQRAPEQKRIGSPQLIERYIMEWYIFFIISAAVLLLFVILAVARAKAKYKSGRLLDPSKLLFAGVLLSAVALFIPIYVSVFRTSDCGIFEAVLISFHNMIRLFVVDGEFTFITSNLADVPVWLSRGYTVLFSILFVAAPVLTFGFVLSFFKNVSAYKRYITHYGSNVFIFSQLNEKSLALAESLYKNNGKDRFFVFTDVFEPEDKQGLELMEKAKEIGAVCFKKDIISIDFSFHSKQKELCFFAIGEDPSENVRQAIRIVNRLKYRENTRLYVFSSQAQAEMLLTGAYGGAGDVKIKVRRVNEVQSLIMRELYKKGYENLFAGAYDDGTDDKKINAVIVGMGQYGKEMTKALSWLCQMDGYLVKIDSFDLDSLAADRFHLECPELMAYSGKTEIEGEARYTVDMHCGIDVNSLSFDQMIRVLPKTTYVFVALGSDEKNIETAIRLRRVFAGMGCAPRIQAVVHDSEKKEALKNIANFKGQKYDIDFIGDIQSSYCEEVILASDIEKEALSRHLKWGSEHSFWQYDYNYSSSVASVIHRKMKELCGMPGIQKEPCARTEEEKLALRILEHRRWNAYMRAQGYVYSGSTEKGTRNDLAKTHNCLVSFSHLPPEEQEKDDY